MLERGLLRDIGAGLSFVRQPAPGGDLCVSVCPAGHYVDFGEGVCRECDPECVVCDGPGPLDCGSCAHFTDATVEEAQQCVSACIPGTFIVNATACVAQCPSDTPFYADTRVTGEPVATCAASCAALDDEATFNGPSRTV